MIPTRDDPEIVIEAKAYGATGSKQTDVLWTTRHISEEKRQDTHFLMFTDGATWQARQRDLDQILELQNRGRIARVYTKAMGEDLRNDLATLKGELGL